MTRKKATLATALILLGSSFALAQTTTTPTPAPPATTTTPAPTRTGDATWYTHQATDIRASKLIGTRVVNAANETVGDVNEVVLTPDGQVAALIVGVGGFLGIGEREVAVGYSSVKKSRDSNSNLVLTMDATRDSLKSAPAWSWKQAVK
jgi:sporulation protein YlmC with PRC-barrel domain